MQSQFICCKTTPRAHLMMLNEHEESNWFAETEIVSQTYLSLKHIFLQLVFIHLKVCVVFLVVANELLLIGVTQRAYVHFRYSYIHFLCINPFQQKTVAQ